MPRKTAKHVAGNSLQAVKPAKKPASRYVPEDPGKRSGREKSFDQCAVVYASFIGQISRPLRAARQGGLHFGRLVEGKRLGGKAQGVMKSNQRAELAFGVASLFRRDFPLRPHAMKHS